MPKINTDITDEALAALVQFFRVPGDIDPNVTIQQIADAALITSKKRGLIGGIVRTAKPEQVTAAIAAFNAADIGGGGGGVIINPIGTGGGIAIKPAP